MMEQTLDQVIEMIGETDFVLYNGWSCFMGSPERDGFSWGGCSFECCGGCESCYAVAAEGDTAKEALLNAWKKLEEQKNSPQA